MNWMDFMMRILLAVLLGFLIGLERQITGHTAGIRINVLISMGSCLFLMFPIITGSDEVYRIASYIVSGVGFLCSGVIFEDGGQCGGSIQPPHSGAQRQSACWQAPETFCWHLPQPGR